MNNKDELFKNKLKLVTRNLISKINVNNTENAKGVRIKIPYNELIRDVLGKDSISSISNNKQTFKNIFDKKQVDSLKGVLKFQKGAIKR